MKLQISRRETPTLPTERRPQIEQSYFRLLPFVPAEIVCLALSEILAEKIRACYQRNKARDIYDLGMFATRPLDQALIRRLVVLKLWQARDTFDPARLIQKFQDGRDFDWDDLRDLLANGEGASVLKHDPNGHESLRRAAEIRRKLRVLRRRRVPIEGLRQSFLDAFAEAARAGEPVP